MPARRTDQARAFPPALPRAALSGVAVVLALPRAALTALAVLLALSGPREAAAVIAPVHVDQFGYAPSDPKWVAAAGPASAFEVRQSGDAAVVFSGPLSLRRASDPASGDNVYEGNFSAFTTSGTYFVRVPGVGD